MIFIVIASPSLFHSGVELGLLLWSLLLRYVPFAVAGVSDQVYVLGKKQEKYVLN